MAGILHQASAMAKTRLIRSSDLPYHVTARTNNREPFHLPMDQVWEILNDALLVNTWFFKIEVHAFVLMPNHFHLMLTTPAEDLGQVMNFFMSQVTIEMNRRSGRTGRVFGGPYHRTLIDSHRYFLNVYRYIYQNPVRAKLCARVEEYDFSTIERWSVRAGFPVFVPSVVRGGIEERFFESAERQLNWLNTPVSKRQAEFIQLGLRRQRFRVSSNKAERRHSHLSNLFKIDPAQLLGA